MLASDIAADRRTARGLILSGRVLVSDRPVTSEHSTVKEGQVVRVRGGAKEMVSRGAAKLRPAIERAGFDVAGRVCLDLGVSTGGFTQVLLAAGAARVYAVDVAYGVAAPVIRDDERVVLLERTNARLLTSSIIPEPLERVVGDLSFISWRAVLPAVSKLLAGAAELLLLVKPQFELAARGQRDAVAGGVVEDPGMRRRALAELYETWMSNGLNPLAVFPAALRGAKGNQEYFVHLAAGAGPAGRDGYLRQVSTALEEA